MNTAKIILPVQVASGWPLRIREPGDMSGGYTMCECASVEEARRVMREYPSAVMPAWRNPRAAWNA
jgi:hypothetical protein